MLPKVVHSVQTHALQMPVVYTNAYHFSFFPHTIALWNTSFTAEAGSHSKTVEPQNGKEVHSGVALWGMTTEIIGII